MELVKGTMFRYAFRRTVRGRYSNSVVNSLIVEKFSKGGPTKRAQLQISPSVHVADKARGAMSRSEPRVHVALGSTKIGIPPVFAINIRTYISVKFLAGVG